MKLNSDQIEIPVEKITEYLLDKKPKNDKSKFLLTLGYSKANWQDLLDDIKQLAVSNDLILERDSEFGDLYSIRGILKSKTVITIWICKIANNKFRFITLYPYYE